MKLFSAFGAADLLERDRQTVRRALRHVPPDGHGQRRAPRLEMAGVVLARIAATGRGGIVGELQEREPIGLAEVGLRSL